MREKDNKHIIDVLFVLALFGAFVVSAIFIISIGANIYSKTMSNMDSNFNSRTAVAYINEKIRQSDSDGAISISSLDGEEALLITSLVNDIEYETYIYEHEGVLRELMVRSDITLSADAGQEILAVNDFSIEKISDSLFKFNIIMTDDESYEFFASIKTGGADNE